jgi:hypothetical protein
MKLTQANIIIGEDNKRVEQTALELARLAVCEAVKFGADTTPCGICRDCKKAERGVHPDIIRYEKRADRTELTIGLIRDLTFDARIMPNEAERKVYILPDAAVLNRSAANAFLKLLEEPPSWVVFILLGERLKDFLPTIRSRCGVVNLVGGAELAGKLNGKDSKTNVLTDNPIADGIFGAFVRRDVQAVAAAVMKLDKAKRDALSDTLNVLYSAFADAALSGNTADGANERSRFLAAAEVVVKPASMLRSGFSLGTGHVMGTLMVELNNLIMNG